MEIADSFTYQVGQSRPRSPRPVTAGELCRIKSLEGILLQHARQWQRQDKAPPPSSLPGNGMGRRMLISIQRAFECVSENGTYPSARPFLALIGDIRNVCLHLRAIHTHVPTSAWFDEFTSFDLLPPYSSCPRETLALQLHIPCSLDTLHRFRCTGAGPLPSYL